MNAPAMDPRLRRPRSRLQQVRLLLCGLVMFIALVACRDDASREPMRVHHEFDYLVGPTTHQLYMRHRGAGPKSVAKLRAALRSDSRAEVRRSAVVALVAALQVRSIPDCIAALDDPAPEVFAEAAYSLSVWGTESTGTEDNPAALRALRAHAPKLRTVFPSPTPKTANVRFNAAEALLVIADPNEDLVPLLTDPLDNVRTAGLRLLGTLIHTGKRKLGEADVTLLDELARNDENPQIRWSAVTLVIHGAAPELSVPVVSAALARGDVSKASSIAVVERDLKGTIPAIVDFLRTKPRGATEWVKILVSFRATCAAQTIARLLYAPGHPGLAPNVGYPAVEALRTLSGTHGEADELEAWANTQPEDVPPCVDAPVK